MEPTFEKTKALYQKHGFYWSDKINIFGYRDPGGEYNDLIGVCYKPDGGEWFFACYIATTEPGKAYLMDPLNPAGTAIVALGQHKNVWKLGYHQGKPDRPALVQCGAFQVYRDNNRDAKIDLTHLQTAKTGGINLHWSYAPKEATTIGKSSAGCQVVKNETALLRILEMVKETGLPTVTYTLFSSTELAAA